MTKNQNMTLIDKNNPYNTAHIVIPKLKGKHSVDVSNYPLLSGNIVKFTNANLNRQAVKEWNDNFDVERIIMEGDLNNISSANKIVAVHDTPGTNFSGDADHRKTTIDFLKNTEIDIILCLINSEYIGTNDAQKVLSELKELTDEKGLKAIFILNKIDSFDIKKESIDDAISDVNTFIAKIGFNDHILIPMSAKAARLFKMSIANKQNNFSENEMDDFRRLFRKFSKGFIAKPVGVDLPKQFISNNDEQRLIDENEYSLHDIETALYNTGFPILENIINNLGGRND